MTRADKNVLMIILGIIMIIVLYIQYLYFKKKRNAPKAVASGSRSSGSDELLGSIAQVENLCNILSLKGIDVSSARSLLSEAKRLNGMKEYYFAKDKVEEAKAALKKAREGGSPAPRPPVPEFTDRTDTILASVNDDDEGDPGAYPHTGSMSKSKEMPENYLQSKFLIGTIRDMQGDGSITDSAKFNRYLKEAEEAFSREDYTSAMSIALKAKKFVEGGDIDTIPIEIENAEESIDSADEEGDGVGILDRANPLSDDDELKCSECGAHIEEDDRFCGKCGAKIEFLLICPRCDAEVSSDDAFCRKCGEKLD